MLVEADRTFVQHQSDGAGMLTGRPKDPRKLASHVKGTCEAHTCRESRRHAMVGSSCRVTHLELRQQWASCWPAHCCPMVLSLSEKGLRHSTPRCQPTPPAQSSSSPTCWLRGLFCELFARVVALAEPCGLLGSSPAGTRALFAFSRALYQGRNLQRLQRLHDTSSKPALAP